MRLNPSVGSAKGVAQHLVSWTVARDNESWLWSVTRPRKVPFFGKCGLNPKGTKYSGSEYSWNETKNRPEPAGAVPNIPISFIWVLKRKFIKKRGLEVFFILSVPINIVINLFSLNNRLLKNTNLNFLWIQQNKETGPKNLVWNWSKTSWPNNLFKQSKNGTKKLKIIKSNIKFIKKIKRSRCFKFNQRIKLKNWILPISFYKKSKKNSIPGMINLTGFCT